MMNIFRFVSCVAAHLRRCFAIYFHVKNNERQSCKGKVVGESIDSTFANNFTLFVDAEIFRKFIQLLLMLVICNVRKCFFQKLFSNQNQHLASPRPCVSIAPTQASSFWKVGSRPLIIWNIVFFGSLLLAPTGIWRWKWRHSISFSHTSLVSGEYVEF